MSKTAEIEILLVEDNPNDVELTLRALKKHNLANWVVVVRDGVEALDYLFATGSFAYRRGEPNPRVVFLDLKLPRVNGIEVLRRLRADERTRTLPIVVMTASEEERDIVEAYQLAVNSYVVKPMDFEQFARVIASLGYYWVAVNLPPPT
ncbi:MAG: response regulator [Chloroflexi bacterium]|nr:response regulator [Chloroflexota bacterium]MCI0579529.1 response regulator [Chloroflexota bacterium]MCI0644431.1 response regulator [Chloroflexota bacterium]MCI0725404.1 response regulator [Chloroflexota bacterium]